MVFNRLLFYYSLFAIGLVAFSSSSASAQNSERTFIYTPSPNWEPLDYFNSRGEHSGVLAGFVTQMELQTGIRLERVQLGSWSEILDSLQTGGAQITIGIHRTPSREAFLYFSDPFLTIPMVILTKRDARIRRSTDLNDKRLVVVRGYASSEYLMNTYPNATFIMVEDELSAMIKTAYGDADAMLIDIFTAGHLMNRYGIRNLVLGPEPDFKWRLHIGVVKSEPELFALVRDYVAGLPSDYDQVLLRSPFQVTFSEPPGFWEQYQNFVIGAFVVIVVILLFFWVLNRRLHVLVRQQVGEIELQNERLREIAWIQSHELRGPLCRMATIMQTLREHDGYDEETKVMLGHIDTSIKEIDQVIHTIVSKTDRLNLDE